MVSHRIEPIVESICKEHLNHDHQFIENFVVVWVDVVCEKNGHEAEMIKKNLHLITNNVKIFNDSNACIDYIAGLKNTRVLLVVSNSVDRCILMLAQNLVAVSVLYILCLSKDDNQQKLSDSFRKVKNIHNGMTGLIEQMTSDIRRIEQELIRLEIVDKSKISIPFSRNSNKQEYSFMYSQLLKAVFLRCQDNSISEMAEYCRAVYVNNSSQLIRINEFERHYEAKKAIWWYTK